MIVLGAVLAAGLVGGALGSLVAWAWPGDDPGAPRLTRHRARALVLGHRRLAAVLHRHTDPAATTAVLLAAVATVLVVTVAVTGLLLVAATSDPITGRSDATLARWAARHADPGPTEVIRQVSRLGGIDGVLVLALAALVAGRRRLPLRRAALFLALVIGGQYLIVNVAKVVIDRARPEVLQLSDHASASFPSGHAAAAAAASAAAVLLVGRGRSRRAQVVLAGVAGGIGFAVAATRVALGVHWSSDVVAGLVVGWGWFALCAIGMGGPALHLGRAVELAQDVEERSSPEGRPPHR